MTKDRFIEITRALSDISGHQVPQLAGLKWRMFRVDPVTFLMMADDADAEAIWSALPARLRQP